MRCTTLTATTIMFLGAAACAQSGANINGPDTRACAALAGTGKHSWSVNSAEFVHPPFTVTIKGGHDTGKAVTVSVPFCRETDVDDEDQATDWSNCVLPSSKFPTALNCCAVPKAMDGLAGVTEIEIRCAATTVNVVLSEKEPTVAVIVVEPAATVVTKPELLMVATAVEDEFQVTPLARSALEPSL